MLSLRILPLTALCLHVAISCSPQPDFIAENIKIAVNNPPEEGENIAHLMGGVEGRFIVEDNCLLFEGALEGQIVPDNPILSVVFPHGTKLIQDKRAQISVQSPNGSNARLGELIRGGGGSTPTEGAPIKSAIPADCQREKVLVIHSWSKWENNQ